MEADLFNSDEVLLQKEYYQLCVLENGIFGYSLRPGV